MRKHSILFCTLAASLFLCACQKDITTEDTSVAENIQISQDAFLDADEPDTVKDEVAAERNTTFGIAFDPADPPAFNGHAVIAINEDMPFFTDEDKKRTDAFEEYSDLDALGRCGVAFANICQDLMPTNERGAIGHIKPSGWHTVKYPDLIEDLYLYNRCHLIGFQLAGENDNEKNLITGTRYLNVALMLPYENRIADYVKDTGNHVLYRVTPIFLEKELVCRGLLMEGWSVEDKGAGIRFCCYQHNIQPGICIDYASGESREDGKQTQITATEESADKDEVTQSESKELQQINENTTTSGIREYVLNTNSMKFHLPTCSGVEKMSENNKEIVEATRDVVMEDGYSPCGICNP